MPIEKPHNFVLATLRCRSPTYANQERQEPLCLTLKTLKHPMSKQVSVVFLDRP